MSNSEDKTPKTNGLGTDPMQRLASFKPPRDLSLGGAKPNKKVFIPNLNVTRNKNKGPSANARDQKRDDKNRSDRRNNKKNFQRNGPNVIKSSGVFSEGLGSVERSSTRHYYGSRDSDSSQTLEKPTIRVKDVIKIDKELEEQKIKSAFGSEYGNLDDEVEDFKTLNEYDAPVKLPMDDGAVHEDRKPLVDVKNELFEETDVVKILKSDEPKLILLQLPDSLPGRGGSVDDDAPRRKNNEPSTSNGEGNEDKPVDTRCRLSDLEEGRIGKLLIHRSGRVTLALGDTKFEVCAGTKPSCEQQVVSVGVEDSARAATLVALGPLLHKLNIAPDWEAMLHATS